MIIFIGCVIALVLGFGVYKWYQGRESHLPRYGAYNVEIAASGHQKALFNLGGGKKFDGVHVKTSAQLIMDNTDINNINAVRVDIQGHTVGYLSAIHAKQFRKSMKQGGTCPALIIGGWQRDREQGDFVVKLDLEIK